MKWLKKLYWRFRYWRAPYIIATDLGRDHDCTVYAKTMDGILYIEKMETKERRK